LSVLLLLTTVLSVPLLAIVLSVLLLLTIVARIVRCRPLLFFRWSSMSLGDG
jgi:hypothetical protein